MAELDVLDPPPASPQRAAVLIDLATCIAAVHPRKRVVIAVDGVDGAGKSVLTRELTAYLQPLRETHRASMDGFHQPRAVRYARGTGPQTFYEDSYDYGAFRRRLIEPFRAGAPFVTAVFDSETDLPVPLVPVSAGGDAVLLVDGIFLHRPELAGLWDASIWVEVPFAISVPRGNARFGEVDAAQADPESASNARWVGGQRIYLAQVEPGRAATWVVDNRDLNRPELRPNEP